MAHYERLKRKRLGEILVDEGVATKEALIVALQEQQRTGNLVSDVLLENRDLSEYDLARVLVDQYQMPFIDLKGYTFHKDLIDKFPPRVLHAARVVPLDQFGKQVCFACQEVPSDEHAAQLREHAPGGLFFFIASAVEIRQSLRDHAPLSKEEQAVDVLDEEAAVDEDTAWKDLFDNANQAVISEIKNQDD